MKVRNWWILETGFLASESDPSPILGKIADLNFPDEYSPSIFLTGDGHRSPPFQWVTKNDWPGFFRELVENDALCVHVEQYPEDVSIHSVPEVLQPLVAKGRVFGWEPDFYKIIQRVMETCLMMRPEDRVNIRDVQKLASDIGTISRIGYLMDRAQPAQVFKLKAAQLVDGDDKVLMSKLLGYPEFLLQTFNAAMALRVAINPQIGANVQREVDRYPACIHLVTCGDAHLLKNPLYLYIEPPIGTFGLVDKAKG